MDTHAETQRQKDREEATDRRFSRIEDQIKNQPTRDEFNDAIDKLATKEDVQPVVAFYNNLILAAKITDKGGKWFSRLILGIVATGIALGVITGWFKGLLVWAVHIATK